MHQSGFYILESDLKAPYPKFFGDLRDPYFALLARGQFDKNNENKSEISHWLYVLCMFFVWVKPKFSWMKFRAPSGMSEMLKLELKLWKSIIRIAERLNTDKEWEIDPIETLLLIIEENALVCLPFGDNFQHFETMSEMITKYQNENNILFFYDFDDDDNPINNPFDPKRRPVTFNFIDCAMRLALSDAVFKKEKYLPMVRNRRAFSTLMRQGGFALVKNNSIVKRGRKLRNG